MEIIDYGGWLADLEDIYQRLDDLDDKDAIAFAAVLVARLEKLEAMIEKQGQTLQ
jgi:hypothetical protein